MIKGAGTKMHRCLFGESKVSKRIYISFNILKTFFIVIKKFNTSKVFNKRVQNYQKSFGFQVFDQALFNLKHFF